MTDNTVETRTYPSGSKKDTKTYRLAKDIVIPAGTEVDTDPPGYKRVIAVPFASLISDIGADKDSCWTWNMELQEALRVGLVEEVV